MTTRDRIPRAALGCAALVFSACSHSQPRALSQAQATYREVAEGEASVHAPSYLETAKTALDRATESERETGDSRDTRDLAYIAERLAMVADAQSDLTIAIAERDRAEGELAIARAELASPPRDEQLGRAEPEAPPPSSSPPAFEGGPSRPEDRPTLGSADGLEAVGLVRSDARGTIVSLTDPGLFAIGSADVAASSRDRVRTLASALSRVPEGRFLIEGHTDSTGSSDLNRRLSLARAQAVRDLLVANGVDAARIDVDGRGEQDPIADNSTPEGRANNRRVDVVIQPYEPTS